MARAKTTAAEMIAWMRAKEISGLVLQRSRYAWEQAIQELDINESEVARIIMMALAASDSTNPTITFPTVETATEAYDLIANA